MQNEFQQQHQEFTKAADAALWLMFKYRAEQRKFKVVQDPKTKLYAVIPKVDNKKTGLVLPKNYEAMPYQAIQQIRSDHDPLQHWEELSGMMSTASGELLRFILHYKVPLEKWIRYELAARGYDENYQWLGFEQAGIIWLVH